VIKLKDVILIGGPTAAGKSLVSMQIAEKLQPYGGAIIINSDSMQIYKDFEILTSRPKKSDLIAFEHRLYGFIPASQNFTVYNWKKYADAAIRYAWRIGSFPIVVGGTGLYFNILQAGMSEIPDIDYNTKIIGSEILRNEGLSVLYDDLCKLDPEGSKLINPRDSQRILRSWEVVKSSKFPMRYWHNKEKRNKLNARWLGYSLMPERNDLYKKIDQRFKKMIDNGAIDEVKCFLNSNVNVTYSINKAIGLKELSDYLNGYIRLEEAILIAQKSSRRLAKRQFTWFRNQMPAWKHFEHDHKTIVNKIFANICKFVLTV